LITNIPDGNYAAPVNGGRFSTLWFRDMTSRLAEQLNVAQRCVVDETVLIELLVL
jgi:hypothetical protein